MRLLGALSTEYVGSTDSVVFEPACQLGTRECLKGIVERRLVNIIYALRQCNDAMTEWVVFV